MSGPAGRVRSVMTMTAAWEDACQRAGGLGAFDFQCWYALRMRKVSRELVRIPSRPLLERIALAVLDAELATGADLTREQIRRMADELDGAGVQAL